MNQGNIFETIPEEIDNEIFNTLMEKGGLKIERILSRGHVSPNEGWYDQGKDEWVILLQGGATIEFENNDPVKLSPGDYINIPSRTRHKVIWTDPEIVTVWLAVHY